MEQKLNNEKVGSFHEPAFLFKENILLGSFHEHAFLFKENILFCVFHKYDKMKMKCRRIS